MLRVYFEGFGFIEYLGFINYYFEKVVLILIGVFVVFCEEEVVENVLNRIIYEVNGCKLKVQKVNCLFVGQLLDFFSFRVLMIKLLENFD